MNNYELEDLREHIRELESRVKFMETRMNGEPGQCGLLLKMDILWKLLAGFMVSLFGWLGVKLAPVLSNIFQP